MSFPLQLLALTYQTPTMRIAWLTLLVVAILAAALLLTIALRRSFTRHRTESAGLTSAAPSSDNPGAFMTASMHAVIQKLREQEKELAALHRKDRERAQQTERLSEEVTRNMPAGLLLVNSAGLITSSNPAAEAALGLQGLLYRRYTDALGADSPLTKLVRSCLDEGLTFRREEIEYATPGGELRKLGVTISPILSTTSGSGPGPANGSLRHVSGALCLLSDLTELAALQRQVQVKESLAALGELSAGIAHEFKNALATISGYAQMIRGESEGDVAENAQRILDQTRALARVVTEFLKFARPLNLATEEVALKPLVQRVAAELRDAVPGVEIYAEGEFEPIAGDEALLRQALLNIVRNAAEAVVEQPIKGQVIMRGSVDHSSGRTVQRIAVADNGPGIPADSLPKVFVPFYTTKSYGTGLGLAIVQKIVVQHGGSVEARNQPQGGAEVVVTLPLAASPTNQAVSAAI